MDFELSEQQRGIHPGERVEITAVLDLSERSCEKHLDAERDRLRRELRARSRTGSAGNETWEALEFTTAEARPDASGGVRGPTPRRRRPPALRSETDRASPIGGGPGRDEGAMMTEPIQPWPLVKEGSTGHPVKTLQYLLRAQAYAEYAGDE